MLDNPFDILGFSPKVLKGLRDEEIGVLIDSQYKALQRIYHPDRNSNRSKKSIVLRTNKALELNDVKEELSKPDNYKFWKEQFLKKKNTPKIKLEQQVVDLEKKVVGEHLNVLDACTNFIFARQSEGPTIYNLENYVLRMRDCRENMLGKSQYGFNKSDKNIWFDLRLYEGKLFRIQDDVPLKLSHILPFGTIPPKNQNEESFTYGRSTGEKAFLLKLTQGQDSEQVNVLGENKFSYLRFSKEQMVNQIRYISPTINRLSYLFGIDTSSENLSYCLLGEVIKIDKLEK